MKYSLPILMAITFCLSSCKSKYTTVDQKNIAKTFNELKSIMRNDQKEKAIDIMDSETHNYFQRLKNICEKFNREELSAHFEKTQYPYFDALHIFSIRTLLKNEDISNKNKNSFLTSLLNHGLYREILEIKLTDIELKTENLAILKIARKYNEKTYLEDDIIAIKEKDIWKFDLTSLARQSESNIKIFCKNQKPTDNFEKCINEYTKHFGKFEIDQNLIWLPMLKHE